MTKGPRCFCFSKIVLTSAIQALSLSCPEVLPTFTPQLSILPDLQVLQIDRFIIIGLDVLVPILFSKMPFKLEEWYLPRHATEMFCVFYIYLSRWNFHSSWLVSEITLHGLPLTSFRVAFSYLYFFFITRILLLFISHFYWVYFRYFLIYLKTKAIFILI